MTYDILIYWLIVVLTFAVIDMDRHPFSNHVPMTIIRVLTGLAFWSVFILAEDLHDMSKFVGWPITLAFSFRFVFNTLMAVYLEKKPWYLGETSAIDRLQSRLMHPFFWWLLDFFMIWVGISAIDYYAQ